MLHLVRSLAFRLGWLRKNDLPGLNRTRRSISHRGLSTAVNPTASLRSKSRSRARAAQAAFREGGPSQKRNFSIGAVTGRFPTRSLRPHMRVRWPACARTNALDAAGASFWASKFATPPILAGSAPPGQNGSKCAKMALPQGSLRIGLCLPMSLASRSYASATTFPNFCTA